MPLFRKEPVQAAPVPPALVPREEALRLLDGEIARAARHGRALSIVIASPRLLQDERLSRAEAAAAATTVAGLLRRSDHAGWLDDSRLLLVLTETDARQAEAAAFRIRTELTRRSRARVINWNAIAYVIEDEATAAAAVDAVHTAHQSAA